MRRSPEFKTRPEKMFGRRFGRLVITGFAGRLPWGGAIWSALCDCGKETTVRHGNIKRAKSCGCWRSEQCRSVAQPRRIALSIEDAARRARQTAIRGTKPCSNQTCDRPGEQPLKNFGPDKTRHDGLMNWCKRCCRNARLLREYGTSLQEIEALVQAQHGKCAGCQEQLSKKQAHVDHDHATGKVRGVLCSQCNRALGLLLDSPGRLRGLLAYAERHAQLVAMELCG